MATLDLNRIAVFVRVVEAGSFTAAGKLLELPVSSVSRSVANLEDELGVRLLHRTTRKLALTAAGAAHGAPGADGLAQACTTVARRHPRRFDARRAQGAPTPTSPCSRRPRTSRRAGARARFATSRATTACATAARTAS